LEFKKAGDCKKQRGEVEVNESSIDCKGMKLSVWFVNWMNSNPVHVVLTFQTLITTVDRVVKSAQKTFVGYAAIIIPTVVKIYNKFMGGTNSFCQKLYYYKTRVHSKGWLVRVFTDFLKASVVNGHILYRDSKGLVRGEKGYTLLLFYEMLIDQLATSQVKKGGWPSTSAKDCQKEDENKALGFVGRHKVFLETRNREKVGGKNGL